MFTSTRDGDIELYTMKVDGSDVRRITRRIGYDGGAFFSPDGARLVWRAMYPETAADSADYRRLLGQRLVRVVRFCWALPGRRSRRQSFGDGRGRWALHRCRGCIG